MNTILEWMRSLGEWIKERFLLLQKRFVVIMLLCIFKLFVGSSL